MAMDPWARAAAKTGEWTSLFRYLNGQSTTRQLEILEDLQSQGVLVGSLKLDHKREWDSCGIGDGAKRLELSCILVLEKAARMKTWNQFVDGNASRFRALPDDWQGQMSAFWGQGPNPGLGAVGGFQPLQPLPIAPDSWKVTDFSVASVAAVMSYGVTAMWGTITFSTYREPAVSTVRTIGLVGISVGKSAGAVPGKLTKLADPKLARVDPNVAAAAGGAIEVLPEAFKLRFPALSRFLLTENHSIWEAAARKAFPESLEKVVRYMPVVDALWRRVQSVSGAKAQWESTASGPTIPLRHAALVPGDFRGTCVGFGLAGTGGIHSLGGMALLFGMNSPTEPTSANGYTGFYTFGKSGQIPGLGVVGSAFWGEII